MTGSNPRPFTPNIVMFCRHFPPAVSGGARRPFYLAKAFEEQGCKVFVIAPQIPKGVHGLAVPHVQTDPRPGPMAKPALRDFLRNWLLWPDPDIRWTRRAFNAAKTALPFKPDLVMTTSPPESIHMAGLKMAQQMGCFWHADIRDNWLVHPFRSQRKNALRRKVEQIIARNWMAEADSISTVNQQIFDEISELGITENKIILLPHFAVSDHTESFEFSNDHIHIVHTGSFFLSDPDCSIEPSLQAFEAAFQQNPNIRLHLVGRLSYHESQIIKKSKVSVYITEHGLVSLAKSFAMQRAADGLLVAASDHASTPPGKAFEYESTKKPIIAIANTSWAAAYNQGQSPQERMASLGKSTTCTNSPVHREFNTDLAAQQLLQSWLKLQNPKQ